MQTVYNKIVSGVSFVSSGTLLGTVIADGSFDRPLRRTFDHSAKVVLIRKSCEAKLLDTGLSGHRARNRYQTRPRVTRAL